MDLFEPGSGSQVHDVNGGILPSGLFWTVDMNRDVSVGITSGSRGRSGDPFALQAKAEHLCGIDTFVIFGPNDTPATLEFEVAVTATGPVMQLGSGNAVPATDPAHFLGRFREARAVGRYSGVEIGFGFETIGDVTSDLTFAEIGFERNGVFL